MGPMRSLLGPGAQFRSDMVPNGPMCVRCSN